MNVGKEELILCIHRQDFIKDGDNAVTFHFCMSRVGFVTKSTKSSQRL